MTDALPAPGSLGTRQLGATGLRVSRVGLGLAALGRPAYITLGRQADIGGDRSVDAMERRCHAMLDYARAAGIRYVDAARSYGRSEAFLASWLRSRALAPGALSIGSKWGYTYVGGWRMDSPRHEVKDLSLAALERQLSESRAHLGTHLDLYQIHSATLDSGVLDDAGVRSALARLRTEGIAVGLTVTGPKQADVIRRALAISVEGTPLFQVVQATWNLLEPSAGDALAEAHERGCGVIVKEAVANGRLTDGHGGDEIAPLVRRARAAGASVDALAFAAALAQPWCDVVLSGSVVPEQLRSNLGGLSLDPGDLPVVAEPPAAYWERRGTLAWN